MIHAQKNSFEYKHYWSNIENYESIIDNRFDNHLDNRDFIINEKINLIFLRKYIKDEIIFYKETIRPLNEQDLKIHEEHSETHTIGMRFAVSQSETVTINYINDQDAYEQVKEIRNKMNTVMMEFEDFKQKTDNFLLNYPNKKKIKAQLDYLNAFEKELAKVYNIDIEETDDVMANLSEEQLNHYFELLKLNLISRITNYQEYQAKYFFIATPMFSSSHKRKERKINERYLEAQILNLNNNLNMIESLKNNFPKVLAHYKDLYKNLSEYENEIIDHFELLNP